MLGRDLPTRQLTAQPVLSPCRGFPKKVNRTARIASDEEIQGSKDAVIQDLERKLRFKEDLLNNGQPVLRRRGGAGREHFLQSRVITPLSFVKVLESGERREPNVAHRAMLTASS